MQQLNPNPELYQRISNEIRYQHQLSELKRKRSFYYVSLVTSLPVFVLAFRNFFAQAHDSGFTTLLKLVISDYHVISAHLVDYFLSLMESLPAVSVAITGVILLVLFASLIKLLTLTYDIRRINKIQKI